MTDKESPPKLSELFRKKVFRRFGLPGLVGIALLSGAVYLYTNWNKVKTWPGVASVAEVITRAPIPKADDPNRFAILLAHLENDKNRVFEKQIIEDLKEFKGIQLLLLDRTILLEKSSDPEKDERKGHDLSRDYLVKSGASVIIWGLVIKGNGGTVPKLYWTQSSGEGEGKRYDAPRLEAQFRLPVDFWKDILRLLVATRNAEFRAKEGHYVADELPPFIARVRTLLEASAAHPGWDADAKGATRLILADSLQVLGDQSGQNQPLEEAVAAYREALKEYTWERAPLNWAKTQTNLGDALQRLGQWESGIKSLEEAVAAYREALKERTRERMPLDWATTQNNLGSAFLRLWQRDSNNARLEEAVAAYKEALKERTREREPLGWAMIQNNLGSALSSIGELESGTKRLKEAMAAYREALKEFSRERVPLYWATTQNNLGTTLRRIGERESGTARLEEAVAACREALKEFTRERVPLKWAVTQYNLGSALVRLGESESGTERLEEAVAAFKAALQVFEPAQATYDINLTKNTLEDTEALLQERRK